MNATRLGKKHLWILSIVLCTYFPLSFATDYIYPSNWYVGGDLGIAMLSLSNSSASVPNGNTDPALANTDLYSISKPGSTPLVSLQGGYRWTRVSPWFSNFTLGLRYQYLLSSKVSGSIEQYSDPTKTNYDYSLNFSTHVLSVLGKLTVYQHKHFAPYVTLGVGEAFNNVGGYSETAQGDVAARTSPGYQSKTAMNTAFSAGLGVDYIFNRKLSMSLGYEYANLGTLKTGNGSGTWSNSSLALGTLTSNTILLGVHYQLPE